MKIGGYELHAIETGRFALDGGAMFGVVPKTLWEKSNPPDARNRIDMAARALLLIGNGRRILIDVGNGTKMNDKLSAIYRIDSTHFNLLSSLMKHGLQPVDITDVILTHLHFDHAGGATYIENGAVMPTFPRAKYYVQREHWEWASKPTDRDKASFFPEDYIPLKEHGLLEFTEGNGELFKGISFKVVHGHTTALQAPVITDGKTTLLYCADLVPMTAHVPLPWIMAYDLRPLVTLEEKRTILGQAVEENWILFFEHDPKTAAAYIRLTDKGLMPGETVNFD